MTIAPQQVQAAPPGLAPFRGLGFSRLGALLATLSLFAVLALPFALDRPNRIVAAAPRMLWESLPLAQALGAGAVFLAAAGLLVFRLRPRWRLAAALGALAVLGIAAGLAATHLTPEGNRVARVAPGGGVWVMVLTFGLAAADALVEMKLSPLRRILALAATGLALWIFLKSGIWSDLSILREYAARSAAFQRELATHLWLALSSLGAAVLIGVPLAILCHRSRRLRGPLVSALNVLQTIPSMALFGLLIAPLAWVGRNLPGAEALGIAGIGFAPAFVALLAYSLLPVVSSTLTGLNAVPPEVSDAAEGVGMTPRQKLLSVEAPLAAPALLTGVRIVLVQNIGLAVIAGLVGGGGLGVFIFQGISQTAADLVLLGALPTVLTAFAAAVAMDALVEISRKGGQNGEPAS